MVKGDRRSEAQAHFAGQLVILRAKANSRPGEWVRARANNGLEIGWRVQGDVEKVALRRPDQLPFEEDYRFVIETLHHEFDGLAVVERRRRGDAVLLAMREQHCTDCRWPVDLEAMIDADPTCTACRTETLDRCADCGRIIEFNPAFNPNRCTGCAMKAGRIAAQKRKLEEEARAG